MSFILIEFELNFAEEITVIESIDNIFKGMDINKRGDFSEYSLYCLKRMREKAIIIIIISRNKKKKILSKINININYNL